jgi:excisionase family DNA binding protein
MSSTYPYQEVLKQVQHLSLAEQNLLLEDLEVMIRQQTNTKPLHSIFEAADILDVSTSHLTSLLDTGKLPFVQVGTERRILLSDLKDYERNRHKEFLDVLSEIAQICHEAGAYD